MIKHRSITIANRIGLENQKKVAEKLRGLTYGEFFEKLGELHPAEILSAIQNLLACVSGVDSSGRIQFTEEMGKILVQFCKGETSFQDLKEESESALRAFIVWFDDNDGDFDKVCYSKDSIQEEVHV
jgi:hypothetical protein